MPVDVPQYPTPRAFGGSGGPFWVTFVYQGPEPKVLIGPPYENGSRDRNIEDAEGTHKWVITYQGRERDLAALDRHNLASVGPAYPFTFWDHRLHRLFSNVFYESYKRDQGARRAQGKRTVTLICEPT